MKIVIAFVVGVCCGIAATGIAKCNAHSNPPRPTDCGCKDCEKSPKCQPRCFCAQPLQ